MRRHELSAHFLRVEAAIGLLARSRPVNFTQEAHAVLADWQKGRRRNPVWRYARASDLSEIRAALQQLEAHVRLEPWPELWRSRCEELGAELRMAEAIGQRAMIGLSERRFSDPVWAPDALGLAQQWITTPPSADASQELTDAAASTSLLCQMNKVVVSEQLPFRVAVSAALFSAAATGEGVIWIASGRTVFQEEVPRIVVHEVFGHAWPRVRAKAEASELFVVGSGGGNDTQEGYAVWHEVTTRTQTVRRRHELALRHLAALSVWQGADWVETVELLLQHGALLGTAHGIALRAHRAGGLAREAVYLQSYCRVRAALKADASVLDWLGAGRLSLDAIATLRAAGYQLASTANLQGENSAITGM